MKIVIYHPVVLPVVRYGGTERVVMWLVNALQKKGHQVSVFAALGSRMPDGIECITDRLELIKRAKEFDVLHGVTLPDQEIIEAFEGKFLVNIHGNGQPGEKFHRNSVFVSRDHARRHGSKVFVYNGIDLDELELSMKDRADRFLFLSKTSWKVKNLGGAIRLLSKFKQNLWVAGGNRPYWMRFVVWVMSLLGRDWRWIGEVNQIEKSKFLQSGKAMVFPILWNEPFGLVIMESLACGTPVLAHPYGSVPELLEFAPQCIMKSDQDWEKALKGEVHLPSPLECRKWVEEKFNHLIMAENYLKLYETLIAGKFLQEQEPTTLVGARDIGRNQD